MKRLLSILLGVTLTAIVISLLWLAWPMLFKIFERNHLIAATWVMAWFTIILAIFTILQGIATWGHLKAFREAQTWDRLRVHSEKLKPILFEWIEKTAPASPGELGIRYGNPVFSTLARPSHEYFSALWEHLKTGYKKNAETWERLEHEFKDHKENSGKFFLMLDNEMKKRVRLPTYYSKGKQPEEWFNSRRCAEILYSVLTGKIEANYYLKDSPPKIGPPKSGRYPMQWPPATTIAMTKNKTEFVVIEQAVTDLIKDPTIVRKANKLSETARDIGECLDNFRDQLSMLIGVIELGGILEGDCKYCRRLKLR